MDKSFYKDAETDFKYPELGVCMEDTEGPYAKIGIPIITPTLSLAMPYDEKQLFSNTNNIKSSTDTMNIEACTESNYIDIALPEDIPQLLKGDKIILNFIGGDINMPYIVRRYIE